MASMEKRLFEAKQKQRKAKFALERAKQEEARQGKTIPATAIAQKALDEANKEISAITTAKKNKTKTGLETAGATETTFADSPFTVTNKILQEFQNENPGVVVDTNFFTTGQGAGLLVYNGKTMGKGKSPTGAVYNQVKDATALTTAEINRFNTDATLKSRVISLLRKYDPQADEIDAWDEWKATVTDAANLYAGGTGIKITPEDLLNRKLAKATKDAPYTGPETTLARKIYDRATIKSWIEEGLLKYAKKTKLDPEDQADLEASILAMTKQYDKTVVTDNRKGMRTIQETPGFSSEQVEAKIKKFVKERDPESYERTKSASFFDWALGLGD